MSLVLITSTLDIAVPYITQHLIDGIVGAVKHRQNLGLEALIASLGLIFLSVAANRVLRSVYNFRLFKTISGLEDQIKSAAFANFLKLDMATHTKTNSGQVIGCLDRGATAIFVILYEILGQNLIPPLIVFAGVFLSLLFKNVYVAFLVFMPLPIYLLIVGRFSAPMHDLEQVVSRGFETVSKESYDIASNVATVKKFSQESRESGLQRTLLAKARVPQFQAERNWAVIENAQTLIATLGRVTVIGFGGWLAMQNRCTIGEYVLFIALQDMLFGPMGQLSILLPKLRRNLARAAGLLEVLDQKPLIQEATHAVMFGQVQGAVDFKHVSFQYGSAHSGSNHHESGHHESGHDAAGQNWTLRHVNFHVPAGSTVALIGRSGTGKSTLINLLLRCYDPQQGSIHIDGVDIRHVSQENLRREIAVVPQEVDLFSRTIAENIAYGTPDATREQIELAARMALAHDFISATEAGYETMVGERGLRLSGGERQRIGIARAILRDPRILVLDEATSHLDTESEHLIQRALERVSKDRTCFIIAHRLSTVRHADVVVVFGNGGIEAVGTHEELWRESPTYRRLHELHASGDTDVFADDPAYAGAA